MGIKVRAKQPGLYGRYREPGHEFEIHKEEHFSDVWMEKLDGKAKGKGKGKALADPSEDAPGDDEESSSDASVI